MSSSGTSRQARNIAVVVAYEPMPSVSKKLVIGADEQMQRGRLHRLVRAVAAGGAAAPGRRRTSG